MTARRRRTATAARATRSRRATRDGARRAAAHDGRRRVRQRLHRFGVDGHRAAARGGRRDQLDLAGRARPRSGAVPAPRRRRSTTAATRTRSPTTASPTSTATPACSTTPRGDWADTIARRFLYELADEARLASIGTGYRPLADLVEKLRREERYHRMHVLAWIDRLARGGAEPRRRLEAALVAHGIDAADGLHAARRRGGAARGRDPDPVAGRRRGRLARRPDDDPRARSGWRSRRRSRRRRTAGADHSDSFRWLWGEFTSVRRSEDGATW